MTLLQFSMFFVTISLFSITIVFLLLLFSSMDWEHGWERCQLYKTDYSVSSNSLRISYSAALSRVPHSEGKGPFSIICSSDPPHPPPLSFPMHSQCSSWLNPSSVNPAFHLAPWDLSAGGSLMISISCTARHMSGRLGHNSFLFSCSLSVPCTHCQTLSYLKSKRLTFTIVRMKIGVMKMSNV